jgi:hypothetical protein
MIDEEAEEITEGSGEPAPDNLDLLPGLFSEEDEELRSSFLALALAFAFSITALLSSRKVKSTMFRYPGQWRSAFMHCLQEGTPWSHLSKG